jgi:TetR/AcrR family transcriptional regulator, fatty acid metabolism regulator protein
VSSEVSVRERYKDGNARINTDRSAGDKRERILDASEQVFARNGFFAARVSVIAKEAGVADGTIYLYFRNKDDLLISLFERRMEQVNRFLADAIQGQPPVLQLRTFIESYLTLIRDQPAAAEVLTIELRQSSKFMKEYDNPHFGDFLRLLGGVISAGQECGELDDSIPAPLAARMIFGILDELATAWLLADGKRSDAISAALGTRRKKFDIVRAAESAVAFVIQGLQKTKTRSSL